jgi:hypothetical protein
MGLFTLTAALAEPLDYLLPGKIPAGHQPKELVASLLGHLQGGKGQALLARRVRTQAHLLHPGGQQFQGLWQPAQLFIAGGHVAVPKLGVDYQVRSRPVGLIGFESLVAVEGIPLVGLNQRGVLIQGWLPAGASGPG